MEDAEGPVESGEVLQAPGLLEEFDRTGNVLEAGVGDALEPEGLGGLSGLACEAFKERERPEGLIQLEPDFTGEA